MATKLTPAEHRRLTQFLADQATTSPIGVTRYFEDLVRRTPMPKGFKQQRIGTFTGQAPFDARALLEYAETLGTNPEERSWTTLGSMLRTILESNAIGLEDMALIASIIESHALCAEGPDRTAFRNTYGVPSRTSDGQDDLGPDIDWQGPSDTVELQSWLRPDPVDLTLEFLQLAVKRARSVCRVEFSKTVRVGSGVLIAPTLVLTNHHVVFGKQGDETTADALARECVVSFSGLGGTGADAARTDGPLNLADTPIVARSRPLDYALLRITDTLGATPGLEPAPLAESRPVEKDGVNLLHHPKGGPMRLSMCDAGVTSILDGPGYVQYIARSAGGSSGGPCFDDAWNVAALHHAERSKPFGRVAEGILIERIRAEIAPHLA
ncbi:MAG TPA: serine protease [Gemmatimonadaceae bacterium]|nr:serine protease [Gemmatimonadaceae bacterium]